MILKLAYSSLTLSSFFDYFYYCFRSPMPCQARTTPTNEARRSFLALSTAISYMVPGA